MSEYEVKIVSVKLPLRLRLRMKWWRLRADLRWMRHAKFRPSTYRLYKQMAGEVNREVERRMIFGPAPQEQGD